MKGWSWRTGKLCMMDGSLQKGHSEIIPVGLTADGRFHKIPRP